KMLHRALREMRHANKVFQPYRHVRKVSVFGSARTRPGMPAYGAAEDFSRLMVEEGYMVITGAGDGIMGAAQHGAGREQSFGLNIRLPFEQSANDTIVGDEKLVTFNYFFTRKLSFVKEADAVVLFPGGFGTLDEMFESITLIQTGKATILPVVLVDEPGGTYWSTFMAFVREHLHGHALISPSDLSLLHITDKAEEAVRVITTFYKVFHSYRHVKDRTVFRIKRKLTVAAVARLNEEFADVIRTPLEQGNALPEEQNEEGITHLPRLVGVLKHGEYGRWRQLIDAINMAQVIPVKL
ncbi:MAG TPA: TIGR00730 family Rossman fold protein, partial [Verrucomicrobium sp.]|nr:TIGR00730 family Rossman fold protein [Verrucomicrobium sp.]